MALSFSAGGALAMSLAAFSTSASRRSASANLSLSIPLRCSAIFLLEGGGEFLATSCLLRPWRRRRSSGRLAAFSVITGGDQKDHAPAIRRRGSGGPTPAWGPPVRSGRRRRGRPHGGSRRRSAPCRPGSRGSALGRVRAVLSLSLRPKARSSATAASVRSGPDERRRSGSPRPPPAPPAIANGSQIGPRDRLTWASFSTRQDRPSPRPAQQARHQTRDARNRWHPHPTPDPPNRLIQLAHGKTLPSRSSIQRCPETPSTDLNIDRPIRGRASRDSERFRDHASGRRASPPAADDPPDPGSAPGRQSGHRKPVRRRKYAMSSGRLETRKWR